MHLKRCLARASQAELIVTCFFFFHVITLTFSSGRKKNAFDYRLTRVCVRACVHAVIAAC